ncbi:helix-turn-helix domain-containing protein [Serratia aquatilis]|uniref:Helix-turn-helix transcriptional regulator n=1 Tax=Serratia aquatilis TaxID=1737515 RepID=A0ABV6EH52_9GAMM
MAQPLSILIVDSDRYFTYGLSLKLQTFFKSRKQNIHLLKETQTNDNIDIIFLGDLVTTSPWLYRLHQRNCHPMVCLIKDKRRSPNLANPGMQCDKCNAGTLYRHQTLPELHNLLDGMLSSRLMSSLSSHQNCSCMSPLTRRETEVLQCLYRGMNGRQTAEYLYISQKTANAHKQNAMRKLNFRCNQELYQWLLQGGGRYLNECSQATQNVFPPCSAVPAPVGPVSSPPLTLRERVSTSLQSSCLVAYDAGTYAVSGK